MAEDNMKIDMTEFGVTGLNHMGGMIYEEHLRELDGERKYEKFKEMRDNSATVGAVLFAIEMLIRNVEWSVVAPDNSAASQAKKEFLESAMQDMEHTWEDFIAEIITNILPFGFGPFEMCFKTRNGFQGLQFDKPAAERVASSRYKDGLIGWKKIEIRSPDTVSKWKLAENGEIEGFWQRSAPRFDEVFIPIEKILLFRTTKNKNNPEGRSALRSCFRPYFFMKKIENIEGIGIERDLAGLPVAYVPPRLLSNSASSEEKATLSAIKEMVVNIRRDEQEGIVFPKAYDSNGKELYDLKLLSTGGSRQFKTDDVIKRYRSDIAMSLLADFILLGHEKVGSFSLSSSKTNIFTSALGAWLSTIAATLNRQAVPLLFMLNGMDLENLPQLTYGDLETVDLTELGNYINALSGAGVDLSDESVGKYLKEQGNIPTDS